MKRTTCTIICLLLGTAAIRAEVTVTPLAITEHRGKKLAEIKGDKSSHNYDNSMSLILVLSGPEVVGATQYGKTEITKAVDDTGQSLVSDMKFVSDNFQDLDEHMWFFHDNPPKDKIKVDVRLEPATRHAKRITALEGSLVVRTTAHQNVLIPVAAGQNVNDPALNQAGVTVNIKKIDAAGKTVELEVNDPKDVVGDVRLVDAAGKEATSGYASFGFNNRKQVELIADGDLKDLQIQIPIATKTSDVNVPFKFTDLPLP